MAGNLSFRFKDARDRTRTSAIPIATPADGAAYTAAVAAIATLTSAIQDLTLAEYAGQQVATAVSHPSVVAPSDPKAISELRWIVNYADDVTGKNYQFTIPAADLSLLPDGTEDLVLADGDVVAAFVAAFEAICRVGPGFDHAVTVESIKFVGRKQ